MSTEAVLFIVLAIAALWLMARWQSGPKGRRGLSLGLFRREKRETVPGLGPQAIRTLIDDTIAFVRKEPGLAGLVLAGSFAAETGKADSTVVFIVPAADLAPYAGRDWLARWPYPARGHVVQQFQSASADGVTSQRFVLRGAPPITIHFVDAAREAAPPALAEALAEGAMALETGTSAAKALVARWTTKISAP